MIGCRAARLATRLLVSISNKNIDIYQKWEIKNVEEYFIQETGSFICWYRNCVVVLWVAKHRKRIIWY
jgi:hypothetical protein